MIPTRAQCIALWDTYALPEAKRVHVTLVERVAVLLAERVVAATGKAINMPLLSAAALLHDIDKSVPKAQGEHHPDTGVRLLQDQGMGEVANVVKTHTLSAILDQSRSPKSWEEKLLYLSDKMVKYEVVGVDGRFALWRKEDLPLDALKELDDSYPYVKQLEHDVCSLIGLEPTEIVGLAR
jgi:HD superfamily phosphohydrolase YqeK